MQGLIVENISNLFKVQADKEVYECSARGKLKKGEIMPVVGDKVDIEITDIENKNAVIEKIYERQVYIKRPKMSNITQLVFVLSSQDPKPDLLLLDKQLAFSEYLKIKSVIVLNKIDLDSKQEFKKIKDIYEKIGYTVIETEAKNQIGIEKLIECMGKNINAFSGNSGVGKSTLINSIFRECLTEEGEVSQKNKRGKNTTTSIKLYEINKDTYIADTPGFSTFEIGEIESKDLYKYFKEFDDSNCKYIGCSHIKEEDCGIKQDVKNGKIDQGRYERFCKIYNELKQREERKW